MLCAPAALADWQYTTWGMTTDEVVSASGGAAHPNQDRSQDPSPNMALLTASYEALGFSFDVYFVFDPAGRLFFVDLDPSDPSQCDAIRFALTNTYGTPEKTGSFGLMKWWHRQSGNAIVYHEIEACAIRYMQFSQPNAEDGL